MNKYIKNTLFTFLPICVILSLAFAASMVLSGCLEREPSPDETLFVSFKVDCPQCEGFKSVKTSNGTLEKCSFCNGQGFVYKNPQGNYKTSQ